VFDSRKKKIEEGSGAGRGVLVGGTVYQGGSYIKECESYFQTCSGERVAALKNGCCKGGGRRNPWEG